MSDIQIGAPDLALMRKILPSKYVMLFTRQPPFHPEMFNYWNVLAIVSTGNLTKLYDIPLSLP